MTTRATREMRAETVVDAPPAAVWRVLSDITRMSQWSPELVRMVALRRGGLRVGQSYLGVNRRGPVVWPTRSVVVELEEGRLVAWDTLSSGARWVWELEPVDEGARTRVVHRRPVAGVLTRGSRIFAPLLLGGTDGHADELEAGMAVSVQALADAVVAAR